jgi:hypothetical protein
MNLEDHSTFYLVPKDALDDLIDAVRSIKQLQDDLNKKVNSETLGGYIDEEKAMELLRRKKTWLWSKRRTGELPAKKAAGRWYYKLTDLQKFIENGRQE